VGSAEPSASSKQAPELLLFSLISTTHLTWCRL